MATGNGKVLPFPSGFGTTATAAQSADAQQVTAPQVQAPTIPELHARMGRALDIARKATRTLIEKAVPGTVELGLFSQYGVIQNALAQLGTRIEQVQTADAIMEIDTELRAIEKQSNEFAGAVAVALANGPQNEERIAGLTRKQLYVAAGGTLAVLGLTSYLVLRKPSRRRKIASFFSGAPKK